MVIVEGSNKNGVMYAVRTVEKFDGGVTGEFEGILLQRPLCRLVGKTTHPRIRNS